MFALTVCLKKTLAGVKQVGDAPLLIETRDLKLEQCSVLERNNGYNLNF